MANKIVVFQGGKSGLMLSVHGLENPVVPILITEKTKVEAPTESLFTPAEKTQYQRICSYIESLRDQYTTTKQILNR